LAAYGFSCKFSGFHSIRKAAPSDLTDFSTFITTQSNLFTIYHLDDYTDFKINYFNLCNLW
ncbi:hypothetical protein, partial [Bacteroides sp. An322]|uniref:hypothetical protein n=1 Tax=Bacteroides sp. An322 TaxID=1965632 RepID=UPI001951CEC1